MKTTTLFISHASEDKDGFVRPLAEELNKTFIVWYDEYSLTVGLGLRRSIDVGLKLCDFGVVVLSPAFFAKKWTNAELDGLFALEEANKKIILPIWHDVDRAAVLEFSPMLVDRVAALSSKGVHSVVADLKRSIDAVKRADEVRNPDSATIAALRLVHQVNGLELDQIVLPSMAGVKLLRESFQRIGAKVWQRVEVANGARLGGFKKAQDNNTFVIKGPNQVCLQFSIRQCAQNSAWSSFIQADIYQQASEFTGSEQKSFSIEKWIVTCLAEDQIGYWLNPRNGVDPIDEDALVKHLVEGFCNTAYQEVTTARFDQNRH